MPGWRHTGVPSRVTVPADGARNPPIIAIRVDFPAPFGPSSPVTPGPIVIVTSLAATTLPYQRETWSKARVLTRHRPSGSGGSGRPGTPRPSRPRGIRTRPNPALRRDRRCRWMGRRRAAARRARRPVSYTHLRAHETDSYLVCRLLLEK